MRVLDSLKPTWVVLWPILAFLVVGGLWVYSTPAGAAGDEASHYVKTVALAHGQLLGDPRPLDAPAGRYTGRRLERLNREAGIYELPASLPPPYYCNEDDLEQPFNCDQPARASGTIRATSFHGKYVPGAYLLPAALSWPATTTWTALIAARFGFLAQATGLFAITVVALRSRRPGHNALSWCLLACGITPFLMQLSGSLAPSSAEILGTAAFAASLSASLHHESTTWFRTSAAVAVFCAWSRDFGAPMVILFALAVLAINRHKLRWLASTIKGAEAIVVAVTGALVIGAILWQLRYKDPVAPSSPTMSRLPSDLGTLLPMARDVVAIGPLVWTRLGKLVRVTWFLALGALVVVALRRAGRVVLLVAGGLGLVYIALNLVLLYLLRGAGYGPQTRFTMGLLVGALVLLAAESKADISRRAAIAVACVVAFGQAVTLLQLAHRHASGLRAPYSFGHTVWVPPGGWTLFLSLLVVVVLVIVGPTIVLTRAPVRDSDPVANA